MYGTCANMRVKPENREVLQKVMDAQMQRDPIPGYLRSYVLAENDSDVNWLFVIFEDRTSYDRNADDPAQPSGTWRCGHSWKRTPSGTMG